MDGQAEAAAQAVEAELPFLLMCPHQAWVASSPWGREVDGGGGATVGVLVPVGSQQMSGAQSLHRDFVRSPTHAGHLLNQRVPGRAGVGPHGAGSRPQTGHARGLPVKLTWGGLQLRVIPLHSQ